MFKKYVDVVLVDGTQHSLLVKGLGSGQTEFVEVLALYVGRGQVAREDAQRRAAASASLDAARPAAIEQTPDA